MDGRARVHGAVTVVNAIPAGRGAAMAIDLWTEARVRWVDEVEIRAEGPDGPQDETLVRACLDVCLAEDRGVEVEVESTIPAGRGLKSSSACANACVLALLRAQGIDPGRLDAVRLGVEAARQAGVTTTGAFDDAAASGLGGICVTDNTRDELLARQPVPDLRAVLCVPDATKTEDATEPGTYGEHRGLFEAAHRWALDGSWAAAFGLNATGVVESLDLDPEPILDALARGAVACGPSGTGPAVAALAPADRAGDVADALDGDDVRVHVAEPAGGVPT